MSRTFKNLTQIQNYIEENVFTILSTSLDIERFLADEMTKSIIEHVYNAYTPEEYERRAYRGGLSDSRNYEITNVSMSGGKVMLTFENLTQGADSLQGQYIGDLIEYGEGHDGKHWDKTGKWSEPRPFSAKMMQSINENPSRLIETLKNNLKGQGFIVK